MTTDDLRYFVIGDSVESAKVAGPHWHVDPLHPKWSQYVEEYPATPDGLDRAVHRADALVNDGGQDWVVVRKGRAFSGRGFGELDDKIIYDARSKRYEAAAPWEGWT